MLRFGRSPVRLLAIGILVAGGVVTSATPSGAATPQYDVTHARTLVLRVINSADPGKAYSSLSPAEKAEFQWAETPDPASTSLSISSPQQAASTTASTSSLVAAVSGCWIATASQNDYSIVGLLRVIHGARI